MVLNLSDQQLLTGLYILVAGFWTHCWISVYHFSVINDLAFFSSNTHMVTLGILKVYLQENPVLRNWRAMLMGCMAILLITSCIMEGHRAWFDSGCFYAQCLFDDMPGNFAGSPAFWAIFNLVLTGLFFPLAIMSLYERPTQLLADCFSNKPLQFSENKIDLYRKKRAKAQLGRSFMALVYRISTSMALATLSMIRALFRVGHVLYTSRCMDFSIGLAWFAYILQDLIQLRNIPPSEMDGNENEMTVGQIIPILLLSSIIIVGGEAYYGSDPLRLFVLSPLIKTTDRKAEIRKEVPSRINDSEISLIARRPSSEVSTHVSEVYPISGALQDTEDDDQLVPPLPRRADTESGLRAQTFGIGDRHSGSRLQARTTM